MVGMITRAGVVESIEIAVTSVDSVGYGTTPLLHRFLTFSIFLAPLKGAESVKTPSAAGAPSV
jgi:hypothetical protein